jgi:iron(III) transport system permease protein
MCDPRVRQLVIHTAGLSIAVALASLLAGTGMAFLLYRTDLPGRHFIRGVLALLLFVPLYLQAAAWMAGFGLQGWAVEILGLRPWIQGWPGAVWIHTAASIPWVVLLVGNGLARVEPELEESALLVLPHGRVFLQVTLRRALPSLGVAALAVLVWTAGEITVTDLLQVRTYPEELYTQLAIGVSSEEAVLRVLPGIVWTAWLAAVGLCACSEWAAASRRETGSRTVVFPLGKWRPPAWAATALLASILAVVPLCNLAWQAGMRAVRVEGGLTREWSGLKALSMVVQTVPRFQSELLDSFSIAATSATAAVTVGSALAWAGRRGKVRPAIVLASAAMLMAVPGTVAGLCIQWLVGRWGWGPIAEFLDRTIALPCLGHFARSLPLATLILWQAFRTIPDELLEAALIEGAGWARRMLQVVLPMRWQAFVAGWLAAVVLSIGELSATVLLCPAGVMPVSYRMWTLLHYGVEDKVAGLCLMLVMLLGVPWGLWIASRRTQEVH